MKKQRTELNYNCEPLKEDEVLVLMPYDKLFAEENVTNPDSIVTADVHGIRVPAILMAVPKAFATEARATFNSWARGLRPPCNPGRCLLQRDDGTTFECPRRKPGDERPDCDHCPYNGLYNRVEKRPVSIDDLMDKFDYCPIPGDNSPEDKIVEEETVSEAHRLIRAKLEGLLEAKPKVALAMFLTALDVNGAEFAEKMRMSPEGAYKVRRKIDALVPGRVSSFAELDFDKLHVSRSKNDEYYLEEARKLLDKLLEMYL